MNRTLPLVCVGVVALGLSHGPRPAGAHPMGQSSICQWAGLTAEPAAIRLHYILDMAEVPSFQALSIMDTNQDGEVSPAERRAYLDTLVPVLGKGLELRVNGRPVVLRPGARAMRRLPGQGGLSTLQIDVRFQAEVRPVEPGRPVRVEYRERSDYTDGGGWREVVVRAGPGCRILESTAPATDQSDQLRHYPAAPTSRPDRSSARFVYTVESAAAPGHGASARPSEAGPSPAAQADRPRRPGDPLARLIARGVPSSGMVLVAILVAAALGGLHALSPGHGKTVVAAYLIGQRSTPWHALGLGLTVTVTHTAGVFALGLVVLAGTHTVRPERIDRWLGVGSGLAVAVIGLALLWGRFRSLWRAGPAHGRWAHLRAHFLGLEHDHGHAPHGPGPRTKDQGQRTLGLEHDHGHSHSHGDRHPHAHGDELKAAGHPDHVDHHGAEEGGVRPDPPPTLGSLIGLGISGGMAPCPSALVVLLAAISIHQVGFGLVLIVAFSLGLAAVLTAIGMLMVGARAWLDRLPARRRPRWLGWLPVASAAAVTVLGLAIALRSFRGA